MSIPDCPLGWHELWTGYSYMMVSNSLDIHICSLVLKFITYY